MREGKSGPPPHPHIIIDLSIYYIIRNIPRNVANPFITDYNQIANYKFEKVSIIQDSPNPK